MIQTAEGSLSETQSILQRMRELAVQSSNDTNTDSDRAEMQKEVNQLAEELTRISDNTEFNTQNLLDGSFTGKFHIGANEGQSISLEINAMDAETLAVSKGTYEVGASGDTIAYGEDGGTTANWQEAVAVGDITDTGADPAK